jgi:hypothetical protein
LENISIELDLEEAEDISGEETFGEEISGEEISTEEPGEDSLMPISFEDISESDELKPEEESFAQVIPEGFVVEPDDSQSAPSFDMGDTDELLREEDLDVLEGDTGTDELPSPQPLAEEKEAGPEASYIPSNLKNELKTVLSYMDQLLESLPEEKIEEFAKSEYFETYKKLFEELGLV